MPNNPQMNQISEVLSVSLSEIQRGLGRVEGKLDQVIIGQSDHEDLDVNRFSLIDKRIALVEKKLWVWSGAIAVIVFVISHFPYNVLFKG